MPQWGFYSFCEVGLYCDDSPLAHTTPHEPNEVKALPFREQNRVTIQMMQDSISIASHWKNISANSIRRSQDAVTCASFELSPKPRKRNMYVISQIPAETQDAVTYSRNSTSVARDNWSCDLLYQASEAMLGKAA